MENTNRMIDMVLQKLRSIYGVNSPAEQEFLRRNAGIIFSPDGAAMNGPVERSDAETIFPGNHSMRAEEGPSYGHAAQMPPMPPRRVDVLGQNGGEPPYQVTPPTPAYSGRELGSTTASQMPAQPQSRGQAVVAAAKDQIAQAAAARQQEAAAAQQGQQPGAFTRLVRGDFTEGADQRIMDAMRRQREESGVDSGMARGGATEKPKKSSRDDVLHKALEIIHQLMMRR